jgi:molybdate transport system ATP-binding protein
LGTSGTTSGGVGAGESAAALAVDARLRRGALELELSLTLAGGCLALAGPSGAGKTTTLRVIAGLERPDAGSVHFGGETWCDVGAGVDLAPERRRCGYVFQEYALFPHLRAWENVAFALRDGSRASRRERAQALLERFDLGDRAGARPRELSGGERQRVALARALALEPRVLLLDEPLAALDPQTRRSATRTLHAALQDAGVPAIVVTHDFLEAALLADEIAVLDHGRIVQRGSAAQLAAAPESPFVADFSGANVLLGVAVHGPVGLTELRLMGGGTLVSSDTADGPAAACVFPWEITLEPVGAAATGSAQNRIEARVGTVTPLGNRVRVGLEASQPLTAEVTAAAAEALGLAPGLPVAATFKATATRLLPR